MHVDAVPVRPDVPADPHDGVVLHGLGEHQVAPRTQHAPYLLQDPGRLAEVMEHVDAPHEPDAARVERQATRVGHHDRGMTSREGSTRLVVLDPDGP